MLKHHQIETPLGPIIAISDEEKLIRLQFGELLSPQERSKPIDSIERELEEYFKGNQPLFKTPMYLIGTPFQIKVWNELQKIPYGQTISYKELAEAIERPSATRAVANANGDNKFHIIIPCHRVIKSDGELGGYAAGTDLKKQLIFHEDQKQNSEK